MTAHVEPFPSDINGFLGGRKFLCPVSGVSDKGVNELKQAIKGLKAMAVRLTPQRRAILEVLQENSGRHLSAEEIYDLVRKDLPGIGLATVYRTLDILVAGDLAHRLDFGEGKARYELSRQEEHHHHHLVCVGCGEIAEVRGDLLHRLEEMVEEENCFEIIDHHLKFYGYCSKCARARKGQ